MKVCIDTRYSTDEINDWNDLPILDNITDKCDYIELEDTHSLNQTNGDLNVMHLNVMGLLGK